MGAKYEYFFMEDLWKGLEDLQWEYFAELSMSK